MCKDNGFNSNSSISNWLNLLKPAYKKIDSLTEEDSINELEKISIKTSLENLKNYPFIQERINNKEINIYGSWINIGSGEIETLNFDTASFHPL